MRKQCIPGSLSTHAQKPGNEAKIEVEDILVGSDRNDIICLSRQGELLSVNNGKLWLDSYLSNPVDESRSEPLPQYTLLQQNNETFKDFYYVMITIYCCSRQSYP